METKAICIEPNYPGTKLYEVGDLADLSEIDYRTRHCWEIGGVKLDEIKELDDKRFYLQKYKSKDAEAVGKKMKKEIQQIEGQNKTLEQENKELKLKLAKLEGGKEKKKADVSKDVSKMVSKDEDSSDKEEGDIF